ncbi:MAG: hypothetical protein RIQ53_2679 [Pseudomonadota bacterium]|jgi:hypothetical protein
MSKPRKKYRPKAVMTNPLASLRPAPPELRRKTMATFESALMMMACGRHPGEEDWQLLSDAVNTVETLAVGQGKLVPDEVMPTVNAAIAGMVGAANRFKAGQGMRVDGPGLHALRTVLDIYEQCLEGLTEREMATAQAETQRRVHALLRARAPSKEVICV